MPDNTKVIDTSPAPSGAANALFDIFKNNTEMDQYAKKKDIDVNAAKQLNSQQNQFATGLAELHNKFQLQQAENTHNLAMADELRKGNALAGLVGEQSKAFSQRTGQPVFGITSQGAPETPGQSTGEETLPWNVKTPPPLAANEAATIFGKTLSDRFASLENQRQESHK